MRFIYARNEAQFRAPERFFCDHVVSGVGPLTKGTDMGKDHGPSIKDDETYEALRDDGYSKETAARIANAQANSSQDPGKKGGKQPPYEEWTKDDLYDRAAELEIDGRSDMNKDELIKALRDKR